MSRINKSVNLSKIIAAVLFVLLPVLGLWIGYQYGNESRAALDKLESSTKDEILIITPTPTNTDNSVTDNSVMEKVGE